VSYTVVRTIQILLFRNWLQLGKGDPEFQLLTEEEIAALSCFLLIFFSSTFFIKNPD
jgi:hypothetical protein